MDDKDKEPELPSLEEDRPDLEELEDGQDHVFVLRKANAMMEVEKRILEDGKAVFEMRRPTYKHDDKKRTPYNFRGELLVNQSMDRIMWLLANAKDKKQKMREVSETKPQATFTFDSKEHVAVLDADDADSSIWYGEINRETQEWKDAEWMSARKFQDVSLDDRQRQLLDAACQAQGVNFTNQD